jgi:subtilisin family serine protease
MKEYIVTLKTGTDLGSFWNEIESTGNISPLVPARPVEISNNRDLFPRKCHYYLTDEEATLLRQDSRVAGVDLPVEQHPLIGISHNRIQQTRNNFEKTSSSTGDYVNWGLVRNSSLTNVYGSSTSSDTEYGYFADGTGVDVVIIDSGIQANHPEFQYVGNTSSRVQQIDWFTESGVTGTMPAGFYTDYDGHGTHVAGIATGKTYGWAKNANIFAIKLDGLEGPADPNGGLTWAQTADVLLGWHQNKTNGRPTVVNMSFAYNYLVVGLYPLTGGTWRGNAWAGSSWSESTYGLTFAEPPRSPARNTGVDDDVDTFVDAGIICCIAANNNNIKIDVPGGDDYDNTFTFTYLGSPLSLTYMQGSSPYSANALIVGALDSTTYSSTTDQKATYSSAGPGVDIFAAGSNVMSACSNTNIKSGQAYYWDNNFKQVNIGGTSMASPQIAGISTLYLQNNPTATSAEVKSWLLDNATYTIYKTNDPQADDYSNDRSQWGGDAPVVYSASQGLVIKTDVNTWNGLANVYVKTDSSTWTQVQNIYTKTDSSTWKQTY